MLKMISLFKFSVAASAAAFATLGVVSTTQAAILGGGTLTNEAGFAEILRKPQFSLEIEQLNSLGLVVESTPIFRTQLTNSAIGTPFTITPQNTSNFERVETLLTNGEADQLAFRLTGQLGKSTSAGGFESFFTQDEATDFEGFFINRLTVTVNSFDADIPGSDPNNDDIWTDYRAQYSFKVAGEPVPEPSSTAGLLATLGFGGLIARKKLRARHPLIKK